MSMTFFWPDTPRSEAPIIPIFIPFWGCRVRCVFCAQHVQSGTGERSLAQMLSQVRAQLAERRSRGASPVELGFFGGTFTALSREVLERCFALVREEQERGTVLRARCSTRPDAVSPGILERLRAAGFATVELGVQSFKDAALTAARRGYDGAAARRACAMVLDAGLGLGVQLLPGMPGVSPAVFTEDVATALDAGARQLRFYPCQVIAGTELARMWREGEYTPWTRAQAVSALAEGWLAARAAGAAVIRMGLAPEKDFAGHVLAGPSHPALGAMVQGEALLMAVCRHAGNRALARVFAPRWCRGFFWGQRGDLRPRWAALGIGPHSVEWQDIQEVRLVFVQGVGESPVLQKQKYVGNCSK